MKPTLKKVVTSLEDASLNSKYLPELFDALSSHLREEGCEKAADQATTLATLFYQKIRIEQARSPRWESDRTLHRHRTTVWWMDGSSEE